MFSSARYEPRGRLLAQTGVIRRFRASVDRWAQAPDARLAICYKCGVAFCSPHVPKEISGARLCSICDRTDDHVVVHEKKKRLKFYIKHGNYLAQKKTCLFLAYQIYSAMNEILKGLHVPRGGYYDTATRN